MIETILTETKIQIILGVSLAVSLSAVLNYFFKLFKSKRKALNEKGFLMKVIPPKYSDDELIDPKGVRFALQRFMDNLTGSIKENRISFEISADSNGIGFYIWTPTKEIQNLVKLNLYSTYKGRIKVEEVKNDYLREIKDTKCQISEYRTVKHDIYMLMDVREFESMDPVQDILTAMTGLKNDEQITFQIVIKPTTINKQAVQLARMNFRLNRSEITWAQVYLNQLLPYFVFSIPLLPIALLKLAGSIFKGLNPQSQSVDPMMLLPDHDPRKVVVEKEDLKEFNNRITEKFKTSFTTYIRVIAVGKNSDYRLNAIEQALESMKSEMQNRLIRKDKNTLSDIQSRFIYPEDEIFPFYTKLFTSQSTLSSREVSMLYHLPLKITSSAIDNFVNPDITVKKTLRTKDNSSDLLLGINKSRNKKYSVYLSSENRKRHVIVTGQTGTGKSTLLKNLILQDVDNRINKGIKRGLLLMDPHEDFFLEILERLPYSYKHFKNLLVWDTRHEMSYIGFNPIYAIDLSEREVDLIVDSNFKLIEKIIKRSNPESGMGATGKPMLINAMKSLMVFQNEWIRKKGNTDEARKFMSANAPTLLDVRSVFSIERRIQAVQNVIDLKRFPDLKVFWEETLQGYMTSKNWPEIKQGFENKMSQILTGVLLYTFGQSRSGINFSNLIRQSQILLVNLSSKNIGEEGMSLLGSMLMSKVWFESKKVEKNHRNPFVIYADEFQNFATSDFSSALSEARKFKLELILAHQFFNQLPADVFHSVIGNVKSKIYYRCGLEDAQIISDELQNKVLKQEAMEIPEFHANAKIGSDVFSLYVPKERGTNISEDEVESLIENSYQKFGKSKSEIEKEIQKRSDWLKDKCDEDFVEHA